MICLEAADPANGRKNYGTERRQKRDRERRGRLERMYYFMENWKKSFFWSHVWPTAIGVAVGLVTSDLSIIARIGAFLLMILVILFIYYR